MLAPEKGAVWSINNDERSELSTMVMCVVLEPYPARPTNHLSYP